MKFKRYTKKIDVASFSQRSQSDFDENGSPCINPYTKASP